MNKGSVWPPKADLRRLMSQYALPTVSQGIPDLSAMDGDEPTQRGSAILNKLNAALIAHDPEALKNCFFAEQSFWKDELALTYHLRTFIAPDVVAASFLETTILRGLTEGLQLVGKALFVPATPVLVRNHTFPSGYLGSKDLSS